MINFFLGYLPVKFLFFIFLGFVHLSIFSQHKDNTLLILKTKDKNIYTWTVGDDIQLKLTNNQLVNVRVVKINDSSIDIKRFELKNLYTQLGYAGTDTFWYGEDEFLFSEIKSIPIIKPKSALIRGGTLFRIIGISAISLNLINSAIYQSFTPTDAYIVGGGVAFWGLGMVLKATFITEYKIGKKYQLAAL